MHRLLLLLLIVAQPVLAADVFNRYEPRAFQLADYLEPEATIGGYPIWAGEGKWRLVDIVRWDSTGTATSVPMGRVSVFQTENKQFSAAMDVIANLSQGSASDWIEEPCKRNDLLFKASLGRGYTNVHCVTINHLAGYMQNPSGKMAEVFAEAKSQGVEIPPTVLLITVTRYASNLRWLQIKLVINPEIHGFERTTENWGRNPWHKSQALKDPMKKEFIDHLSQWSVEFAKAVDKAFQKKSDAFVATPTWRLPKSSDAPLPEVGNKLILD